MIFDKTAFASALLEKRKATRLSVRKAALEASISPATFSRLELAMQKPDIETYALCCQWLTLPLNTFFKMQNWYDAIANPPKDGEEVMGYNKEWIDLDFNPSGTCLCFISAGDWTIASWDSAAEWWVTRYSGAQYDNRNFKEAPTNWMPKPAAPHE